MAELTKLGQLTNDMVSAWRDRDRNFHQLARLDLTDEQRQTMVNDYAAASAAFDKAKSAVISSAEKPASK